MGASWGRRGPIYEVKNIIKNKQRSPAPPERRQPQNKGLLWDSVWGSFFMCPHDFGNKNVFQQKCFLFWFWGLFQRLQGWFHKQSSHACEVQTHLSVLAPFLKSSSPKTSFCIKFGCDFHQNLLARMKTVSQKLVQKKAALTQTRIE